MPQPIMKKYKHGEFGADYPKSANEKLDGSIMKKYKHGEFSDAGGKASKEKLASWSKEKIKHGSFNSKKLWQKNRRIFLPWMIKVKNHMIFLVLPV